MATHGRFRNPVEAVLVGTLEFFRRQTNIRPLTDSDRLDGRNCLITGASSGVGYALALELARRGAHLLLACRSGIPQVGEQIKALSGNPNIAMLHVDLADLDSVHHLADTLRDSGVKLDVVHCNAGVTPPRARKTPQGLDEMFTVNYLSTYVLLNRLLSDGIIPNANFSGNPRAGAPRPRIIITSSDSHRNASAIDFDELGVYRDYGVRGSINNYSYFKLILNTFATELSRRLKTDDRVDVSVFTVCPGPVNSNIIRDAPPLLRRFLRFIFTFFFQTPAKAAPPLVYLACAPEMEGRTNVYLHMMAEKRMDEKVYDEEAGKRLWEKSEGACIHP